MELASKRKGLNVKFIYGQTLRFDFQIFYYLKPSDTYGFD